MTRLSYSSWGGAIQRELLTDHDNPYAFAQRVSVTLPDIFFERNRALAEDQKGSMKLLARVPMFVYEQSLREEWDDADWAKWLNDPDNAAFRVWPGKV
jgi:hypothetical protein